MIDRLGIDKKGYLTMVGNNQCSFRDSSVVDELEPIKPVETQPVETIATTENDGSTETTTTATTTTAAAENP